MNKSAMKYWLKKMHLKMWSANWWPFCFGLNVSTYFSGYILHFQWDQVKCHRVSFIVITQDLSAKVHRRQAAQLPSDIKPLHETSFPNSTSHMYCMTQDLHLSSKRTGDTMPSCVKPVLKCRKFWRDFCFPSFIWNPRLDKIVALQAGILWSGPPFTNMV